jgi:glutamate-5-semialdehyde dehydrogenase
MVEGLQQIVTLADPIGEISNMKFRPSGIRRPDARAARRHRHHLRGAPERTVDAAGSE